MKLLTSVQRLRSGVSSLAPAPPSKLCLRKSSTQSELHERLTKRPPNYIFDYLTPMPSHLLNIALADFLPENCYPAGFKTSDLILPTHTNRPPNEGSAPSEAVLPQGHHLVYFPPQVLGKDLLADGTDVLHSPGPPFVRRMWAGGSLIYSASAKRQLDLRRKRSYCLESIADVQVRGTGEEERVVVDIERRVAVGAETLKTGFMPNHVAVLEKRKLVFLKDIKPEAALARLGNPDRVIDGTRILLSTLSL
jgi:hypothetical protein